MGITNALVVRHPAGFTWVEDDDSQDEEWGRWEALLTLNGARSTAEASALGRSVLDARAWPRVAIRAGLEPGSTADEPYTAFQPGDWVTAPGEDGMPSTVRVAALTVTEDDLGNPVFVPELGQVFEETEQRLSRLLSKWATGTLDGTSDVPTGPDTPGPTTTTDQDTPVEDEEWLDPDKNPVLVGGVCIGDCPEADCDPDADPNHCDPDEGLYGDEDEEDEDEADELKLNTPTTATEPIVVDGGLTPEEGGDDPDDEDACPRYDLDVQEGLDPDTEPEGGRIALINGAELCVSKSSKVTVKGDEEHRGTDTRTATSELVWDWDILEEDLRKPGARTKDYNPNDPTQGTAFVASLAGTVHGLVGRIYGPRGDGTNATYIDPTGGAGGNGRIHFGGSVDLTDADVTFPTAAQKDVLRFGKAGRLRTSTGVPPVSFDYAINVYNVKVTIGTTGSGLNIDVNLGATTLSFGGSGSDATGYPLAASTSISVVTTAGGTGNFGASVEIFYTH